jgi:hypothetical protein
LVGETRRREKRNIRQCHKQQGQKTLLFVALSRCEDMAVEKLQAPPTVMQECVAQETTQT